MELPDLLDPRKTALIVVDMQNDFCDSHGAFATHGGDPSMIQAMAPRLLRLLEAAREIRLPIVHVRTHHSDWTDSASWLGRHATNYRLCFPGSWGADYFPGFEPRQDPEWGPGSHEYVVTKHRYSGFVGTDLDMVLRSRGVQTVIMTGEATNVCVETTARDAYMRDYFVAFVSDCTASGVRSAHEATLFTIGKHFGAVVTSDEIIATWDQLGAVSAIATRQRST
ncbi:MAG TPA: isochorismatase family cysteine hydrolase [Chloroflexota bacterium]|nr:isochorismatase family cysteine hydrolase [Chloroflexota bacterium]